MLADRPVAATAANINRPPVARAGANTSILLPTDSILLNGTASFDPDNNIKSYRWRKLEGPPASTISNSSAIKTLVTGLTEGMYLFELTVTDSAGLSSSDTLQVLADNPLSTEMPLANAGPDQTITLPLDSAYLDGSNSRPNGWSDEATIYSWSEISGPSSVQFVKPILYSRGYVPTTMLVIHLVPGDYVFRLEVKTATAVSADTIKIKVVNDPLDRNSITFHHLIWQTGDVYGLAERDVFLNTSLRNDLFTNPALHVFLDINSDQNWLPVSHLNKDKFSYDAIPELLWIITYPADFSLLGKLD